MAPLLGEGNLQVLDGLGSQQRCTVEKGRLPVAGVLEERTGFCSSN